MTHSGGCQVHLSQHRPSIDRATRHTVDNHHIWPRVDGGPDTAANIVRVCPTGHTAIHELLRVWLKLGGEPSWEIRRHYHPNERRYARLGYQAIQAAKGTP